ncbi:sarcosine oxidase subunit gamma family protein [Ascidiaceihabitans sp.]|uniref:sarcosine oxidase subunit gamma n=1 Tax=Ascidiaceihabitans sp. TaxID=1872644 RepID=UPI003299AC8E
MSNPISALNQASDAAGIATVADAGLQGMITLRGDLSDAKVKKAATSVTKVALPETGQANTDGAHGIVWMSPDELMVLCPYDAVADTLAAMHKTLGATHALAVDVSDARACLRLSGANAREVLAKVAPVDLRPAAFTAGMFRRTRIAQIPAAFWMPEEDVFQIICFRSNAKYLFDVLTVAAQPGSEVGHF